jgi:hypothetical protein
MIDCYFSILYFNVCSERDVLVSVVNCHVVFILIISIFIKFLYCFSCAFHTYFPVLIIIAKDISIHHTKFVF